MAEPPRRKTAKKLLISDIMGGTYIKRPGWEPSGILTKFGEISRVNLMGVVVSVEKDEQTPSFILDDGSGTVLVRSFDKSLPPSLSLGELVCVIGRPREWSNTKYILPETIKKIEDKKWYSVRQLEIKLLSKTKAIRLPVEQEQKEEEIAEYGPSQKILNAIAVLDKGDGADIQDIIKNVQVENSEAIISSLIEEGEIYAISPGKVKLLG